MREPGNHDNGASDIWALTAYIISVIESFLACGWTIAYHVIK